MKPRRTILRLAGAWASSWPIVVFSQQPARRQVLGFLLSETREGQESRLAALRTGLQERGYVEGRNIAVELRSADGDYSRLPRLADELARLKVDVMVAFGSKAVLAARCAVRTFQFVAPSTARVAMFVNPAIATAATESMRQAMKKAKEVLGAKLSQTWLLRAEWVLE